MVMAPAGVVNHFDTVRVRAFDVRSPAARESAMHIYMYMYFPVLITACIATAGCVVAWALNGGGIDPGPPNARI